MICSLLRVPASTPLKDNLCCCSDVGALLGYLRPAAPYVMPIAASALTSGLGLQATQVRPILHQSQGWSSVGSEVESCHKLNPL
jgi:hypothetical protein